MEVVDSHELMISAPVLFGKYLKMINKQLRILIPNTRVPKVTVSVTGKGEDRWGGGEAGGSQ